MAATSIDTTRLNNAITDTQNLFAVYCGVTYDNTNGVHVIAAVATVVDLCRVYSGQVLYHEVEDSIVNRFKAIALVTGRDRISPTTDSMLNPTQDTANTTPKSDRGNFRGYRSNAPGGSQPYD